MGPAAVVMMRGNPRELAAQQAVSFGEEIHRLARRMVELADPFLESAELLSLVREPESVFTPAEVEELATLAQALDLPFGTLIALQLSSTAGSVAAGSHIAVRAAENRTQGLLHAAAEREAGPLTATKSWPRRWQMRAAAGRAAVLFWSLPGQIGGLHGINRHGLAISCVPVDLRTADDLELGSRLMGLHVKRILESAHDPGAAVEALRATESPATGRCC